VDILKTVELHPHAFGDGRTLDNLDLAARFRDIENSDAVIIAALAPENRFRGDRQAMVRPAA
jgi:hypothetical protein